MSAIAPRLAIACIAVVVTVACVDPSEGVAPAEVRESGSSAAPADGPDGTRLVFAPESTVAFTGSKITKSHEGGFRTFGGEIVLVDGDPARSRVAVEIDTRTIWADNDRLTGHLKSADFFDVEQYPTATFRSTAIAPTADGYAVTGDLDLHGVVKSVTFPATIEVEGDRVTARAEFVLHRFDFDIRYPGLPDDLIRDEVVVRLDLAAIPESGEGADDSVMAH